MKIRWKLRKVKNTGAHKITCAPAISFVGQPPLQMEAVVKDKSKGIWSAAREYVGPVWALLLLGGCCGVTVVALLINLIQSLFKLLSFPPKR